MGTTLGTLSACGLALCWAESRSSRGRKEAGAGRGHPLLSKAPQRPGRWHLGLGGGEPPRPAGLTGGVGSRKRSFEDCTPDGGRAWPGERPVRSGGAGQGTRCPVVLQGGPWPACRWAARETRSFHGHWGLFPGTRTSVVTVVMVGVGPVGGALFFPSSVHHPSVPWVLLLPSDPGAARAWQGGRPQF